MKSMLAAILIFLAAASGASADFNAGEAALHAGNFERALAELVPAAARGDARAQNALALLYRNGWGVVRDDAHAADLLRRAAKQGFSRAEHNLALLYQTGLGVERDETQAVEWLKRAARRGYVPSQSDLGFAYYAGQGVPRDLLRAYFWWTLAASRMDLEAARAREDIIFMMTPHQKRVAELLAEQFEPDR
jgi:TPR repeat protein